MKIVSILMVSCGILANAETVIENSPKFASSLYTEIAKNQAGSFIVGPLSVQLVLALAAVGARGKTAEELSSALHIPPTVAEIEKTFGEITPHLKKDGNYTLVSANKIYTANNFELDSAYKSSLVKYFQSEAESVNFLDQQTVDHINAWVSNNTFGKIKDLVQPNSFTSRTQMVLINTLFFKGFWEKAFNPLFTQTKSFFLSESEEKEVEMMEITDKFKYAYNNKLEAQFLELFYRDSDISMTIVLPDAIKGVSLLEARLGEIFEQQEYYNAKVHVQIPKFATKSTIKLNEALQKLGIKEAFGDSADFTGIGGKLVKIDEVLQKALIEVDEEGTTAVAATGGIMVLRPAAPEFLVEFLANHGFIYYLQSKSVGVLFVGRYLGQ